MKDSKGSLKLAELIRALYGPGVLIKEEHVLDDRLRLDYYLPFYKIAFEFHGRQHSEFVEHFHGSALEFEASKKRDQKKIEWCASNSVALVTVWDHEELTVELLKSKILRAEADLEEYTPVVKQISKLELKRKEYREVMKQWRQKQQARQSEYNKNLRRERKIKRPDPKALEEIEEKLAAIEQTERLSGP